MQIEQAAPLTPGLLGGGKLGSEAMLSKVLELLDRDQPPIAIEMVAVITLEDLKGESRGNFLILLAERLRRKQDPRLSEFATFYHSFMEYLKTPRTQNAKS